MKMKDWVKFIKEVAQENDFQVTGGDLTFEITKDHWHSVAFRVVANQNTGYLEISQWEQINDENGMYGRAVYSLRQSNDVALFCSVLISSASIRAKR